MPPFNLTNLIKPPNLTNPTNLIKPPNLTNPTNLIKPPNLTNPANPANPASPSNLTSLFHPTNLINLFQIQASAANLHALCQYRKTSTVYVLFVSLTISNGCGSIVTSYATSTASIPQDQLSSIDANDKAQPYNLADLPCPPPNIPVPPGQLYQPKMAWVGQFYSFADPAIAKECHTIGGSAGFLDPPTAFVTALGGLGGPGDPGHHPRHLGREPAKAVAAPCMPAKTPTAT